MIEFLPAPTQPYTGLLVADGDMEEEYHKVPVNIDTRKPVVRAPGVGEIKPHARNRISEAHDQLSANLGRYRELFPKGTALDAFIITYRPVPPAEGGGRTARKGTPVDVYATPLIRRGMATEGSYLAQPWWKLERAWVRPTIDVSTRNPSVFGAAAEQPVRASFAKFLAAHRRTGAGWTVRTRDDKASSDPGPDVEWREVAEMYAELARTTNDEFLAELANELATLG